MHLANHDDLLNCSVPSEWLAQASESDLEAIADLQPKYVEAKIILPSTSRRGEGFRLFRSS